jgi:hypothetical protein
MKVILQTRDIQILKFIFACRAVTYNQVRQRHFGESSATAARRRLKALARAGYLKTTVIELFEKVIKVVQPLPKSWEAIEGKWPFEIDKPYFKSESLEHDVRLADLFLRFEKLACFRSFITENLLASSKTLANDPVFESAAKIHSDGVLSIIDIEGQLKVYAVEIELSKKTVQRYTQKLVDYYLSQGLDGVLYISPSQEIQRLLAKVDAEVSNEQKSLVYFASEDEVKANQPQIIFKNRKEQALVFK